jgi:dipeptidyl aminopeptidase/acylaminoacyl peptidase
MTDDQFRVRFAVTFTPDAGQQYLVAGSDGEWTPFMSIEPVDTLTTHPVGFDKSGEGYFILDSRGRDKSVLKHVRIDSGEERLLAESDFADIDDVLFHPTEKNVQAVSYTYDRQKWIVLDPDVESDLKYLESVADGEAVITSRTLDDTLWTVAFTMDTGPVRFYLYDRRQRRAMFLFSSQPELEGLALTKMHPVVIAARDGLEMVSYLSLPAGEDSDGKGRPKAPLPMVVLVHGGPWARDSWGYSATHQWLADRGYAVLAVNFRGSTGFGKGFINKGNREWAAAMHDDLLDAVDWAVGEGIARPDRVTIMGGSYGGYATLVGLAFTPERFSCGVDIVGPSNLVTLMDNPPPYWMPLMSQMKLRVGDYSTPEGRAFLESRSPLFRVGEIVRPLLIGQGRQDPRVKQAESDQIVEAMRSKGIPVTYMLFTEEGHGFAKPENRLAFFAVTEAFLARHMGGGYEPIGEAFSGAAFTVPEGREGVPGLSDAMGPTAG